MLLTARSAPGNKQGNMQVSKVKLSLASAKPVYYYSVYPETLQPTTANQPSNQPTNQPTA
jgi:hypothetical protein